MARAGTERRSRISLRFLKGTHDRVVKAALHKPAETARGEALFEKLSG